MFKRHLRLDHSVSKDGLGRANCLKDATLRIKDRRAYLSFNDDPELCVSNVTMQQLRREGWRLVPLNNLMIKDLT